MHSSSHALTMHCIELLLFVYILKHASSYKNDPWVSKDTFSIEGITIPLFHFGEKSYYVGESKLTYFEADQFCKNINMDLVAVHSSDEFEALWNYIQRTSTSTERKYWTSGSILLNGYNWIWMSILEPVKFTKWKLGEPSNRLTEKCLEFLSDDNVQFFFNDRDCDAKVAFICERDSRHIPYQIINMKSTTGHYPNDQTLAVTIIDNVKYGFSKYTATQEEASKNCKKYGMELVSIPDKRKSDIIINLISNNLNPTIANFFWTAAKKQTNGKWIWGESQPMAYTNWATHDPNNIGVIEICLHLFANGQWNANKCDDKFLFICEGPNIESSCESQPVPIIYVYLNNNQKVTYRSDAASNNIAYENEDGPLSIQPRGNLNSTCNY